MSEIGSGAEQTSLEYWKAGLSGEQRRRLLVVSSAPLAVCWSSVLMGVVHIRLAKCYCLVKIEALEV